MRNQFGLLVLAIGISAVAGSDALARGFGGFHGGGGARAGGVGGGGLGGGDFRGGGFDRSAGGFTGSRSGSVGGFRAEGPRGGSVGGFRASGESNFAAGGMGGGPSRSGLNSFLGMPSDAGLHHIGNADSLHGFDANRVAGAGPFGGAGAGERVRGPRGGSAGRGVAVGPGGRAVGGRYVTGPRGNTVASGFVAGPHGFYRATGASLHDYGTAVRSSFRGYDYFRPNWYAANPGCWYTNNWAVGNAWTAATWNSINNWLGYRYDSPLYYNYGTNVVYNGGDIYVDNQNVGTEQQYYETAANVADAGAQDTTTDQQQWMPLGVFAASPGDQANANMVFQLAVNKQGTIRGNYTNNTTGATQKVQGSVDKKTQTANWVIDNDKSKVFQTGLYNFTKEQAPCLVLQGNDKTQQWLLVRLQQPKEGTDQ